MSTPRPTSARERYYDREAVLHRGRLLYRDQYDSSGLAEQFWPYLGADQRIRVLRADGTTHTGRVGISTGARPAFLLITRANSSVTRRLRADDQITGVQRHHGGQYA
jgi:hypothetical protein